ncbi:hypothetical protein JCM6882_001912 [Rhodosporidiobolus microsporus]
MPLFPAAPAAGSVPVFNSACPWASSREDLQALWDCEWTSAVTTRTCTLNGFPDDQSKHQVAFFGPSAQSSSNCYGYSPFPLAHYLDWIRSFLATASPEKKKHKQVIVSVTGDLGEMEQMLKVLQAFADEQGIKVAVEYNASCPNVPGHPPPAYSQTELIPFLDLLAAHASPTLKMGVKLPPYTYEGQFVAVVKALEAVKGGEGKGEHPVAFLTSTNTLGQGLVFSDQIVEVPSSSVAQKKKADLFALPNPWGGLAGAAIHNTSLGNIYRLSVLLNSSSDARLKSISLIGVGGAHDAASVERYRRAGASAVACATALGREGLAVFEKMSAKPSKL